VTGVAAAVLSSALGGSAAALTRYVIGATDPVTLAAYRFGIGFLLIFPLALLLGSSFPKGKDRIWVALLGVLFFSIFFVFYNIAMSLTTAARGSLALSCLPLTTMLVAKRRSPPAKSWEFSLPSAVSPLRCGPASPMRRRAPGAATW
jgi:drug/metabolite transporter (DMT)-like permease